MNSPRKENDEVSSSTDAMANNGESKVSEGAIGDSPRPPAKRPPTTAVIEISDTESDDSDVCAINTYQATADEVKRIRGADYSSSSSTSSSSDYSSDSESPWEDDSIVLEDDLVNAKVIRSYLNPRANRMDDPKINPNIKDESMMEDLKTHWVDQKDFKSKEVTLTCDPFRLCRLHNLLDNPEIINNIIDDMNTLDWTRKRLDLYEFHQTADLASLTWQRSIRGIYELLKTEIMSWVSQITGLELTTVSASCSLYGPGDHLLVHDDLMGDRRVAFILYLAPWTPRESRVLENGDLDSNKEKLSGWSPRMGGALQLLGCDEDGGATEVVRSVFPSNNTMALFQVGPETFHQVDEVLSVELPRLSINGWFHGPAAPVPTPHTPHIPVSIPLHKDVVVLNQWVEASYMSPRCRAQIQQQMERDSEVALHSFLAPEKCEEIMTALRDPELMWEVVGPAHKRNYSRLQVNGGLLGELVQLWASVAWGRLLAECTDLNVTTYRGLEVQRWSPGDYTLLPSREYYQQPRLEALLYLGGGGGAGGSTVFVAPEEAGPGTDAALVSVPPAHNALALVYCDVGAAGFTKYRGKLAASPHYLYLLKCSYLE